MPRLARIVVPGVAHHITQRGNRRQNTFFCDRDYSLYLKILSDWTEKLGIRLDSFCLMPNHVHLILVPPTIQSLSQCMSEVHRRYTKVVNRREGWSGCLWQGRFFSVPLDEKHYAMACEYVEQNPVRARICKIPEEYLWSSAFNRRPVARAATFSSTELSRFRKATQSGRPFGSDAFLADIERNFGVDLSKERPGRKSKEATFIDFRFHDSSGPDLI